MANCKLEGIFRKEIFGSILGDQFHSWNQDIVSQDDCFETDQTTLFASFLDWEL